LARENGAELTVLVQELLDADEADWFSEPGPGDRRLAKLLAHVHEVIDDFDERRLVCPLTATSTGTFFGLSMRRDELQPIAPRLQLHAELLGLLRALDPNKFERLCGRVLEHIKCSAVFVSRSSVDSGVDFIGRYPIAPGGPLDRYAKHRVLGALSVLLVGQAKRYSDHNKINEELIKQIEGTWGNLQRGYTDHTLPGHLERVLIRVGWRAGDAVRWVFVTTGSYTVPALRWADTAQMATLDGDQLTQFLLQEGLGITQQVDGSWHASAQALDAWCR
jgi:hypothetical protein